MKKYNLFHVSFNIDILLFFSFTAPFEKLNLKNPFSGVDRERFEEAWALHRGVLFKRTTSSPQISTHRVPGRFFLSISIQFITIETSIQVIRIESRDLCIRKIA